MNGNEKISENLRFLLWQRNISRDKWCEKLSRWALCDFARAKSLLYNGDILPQEQDNIIEHAKISDTELRMERLVSSGTDILKENIRFLLRSLPHGKKKELAEKIKVHTTTVTRWQNGEQVPNQKSLAQICRFFGIDGCTDLKEEPLFLSLAPVSDIERKKWLHECIERMEPKKLRELYPALARLLGD